MKTLPEGETPVQRMVRTSVWRAFMKFFFRAIYNSQKEIMTLLQKEYIPGTFYELEGLANGECLKEFCTHVK